MNARLSFAVLGPLQVCRDGEPLRLGGPKERLVLATLLLSAGRVVGRERLVDVLWDEEPPARAVATLQVHVSNLRRRLGGATGTILTQPPGYLLMATAADLDVLRFEELVALARERESEGDPAGALSHLDEALRLWRGQGLADLEATEFVQSTRAFLDERRIAVEEDRLGLLLSAGRAREALGTVVRLIDSHPLRESLWEHRMLALYRLGRQAESLAVFRNCRERLLDDLGVEPTPRLRAMELAILNQDPNLDQPSVSVPDRSEPGPVRVDVTATFVAPAKSRAVLLRDDGSRVDLDTVVTLGRHPDCDVVFLDPAVSRHHVEIRPAVGGHLLSDLMSSNGTHVGEEQVMHHLLTDGDVIRIGGESLHYARTNGARRA